MIVSATTSTLHRGYDAEEQGAEEREGEREPEHDAVDVHGVGQRQVARRERDECPRPKACQRETRRAAT